MTSEERAHRILGGFTFAVTAPTLSAMEAAIGAAFDEVRAEGEAEGRKRQRAQDEAYMAERLALQKWPADEARADALREAAAVCRAWGENVDPRGLTAAEFCAQEIEALLMPDEGAEAREAGMRRAVEAMPPEIPGGSDTPLAEWAREAR